MELKALTDFREKHSPPLSQADLAALLGVKRETVNRWESGGRKIGPANLALVAAKTGIPPRDLRPDLAEVWADQ